MAVGVSHKKRASPSLFHGADTKLAFLGADHQRAPDFLELIVLDTKAQPAANLGKGVLVRILRQTQEQIRSQRPTIHWGVGEGLQKGLSKSISMFLLFNYFTVSTETLHRTWMIPPFILLSHTSNSTLGTILASCPTSSLPSSPAASCHSPPLQNSLGPLPIVSPRERTPVGEMDPDLWCVSGF